MQMAFNGSKSQIALDVRGASSSMRSAYAIVFSFVNLILILRVIPNHQLAGVKPLWIGIVPCQSGNLRKLLTSTSVMKLQSQDNFCPRNRTQEKRRLQERGIPPKERPGWGVNEKRCQGHSNDEDHYRNFQLDVTLSQYQVLPSPRASPTIGMFLFRCMGRCLV